MKKVHQLVQRSIRNHAGSRLAVFYLILSCLTAFYFVYTGSNLHYFDAVSRLNIARRMIDSLSPGLAQIGSVWLPIPQIFFLPFIWIDPLWRSGGAALPPNMLLYVGTTIVLYKLAYRLTHDTYAAVLASAIYGLNINILYYQSTSMSEIPFLFFIITGLYFLLRWSETDSLKDLLPSALAFCFGTLTRYEGLALFAAASGYILWQSKRAKRSYSKTEGSIILFGLLGGIGFFLWTLYSWAIFQDPLSWLHYYATAKTTETGVKIFTQNLSFFQASWKFFQTMIWMNGIFPVLFSLVGSIMLFWKTVREKSDRIILMLVPFSVFFFTVFSLMRNTPITQPTFGTETVLNFSTNYFNEFNIRYGLVMIPWIALTSAFLFASRKKIIVGIVSILFFLQILNYAFPFGTTIYQIPVAAHVNRSSRDIYYDPAEWLTSRYQGGFVLASAQRHDPLFLLLPFPYRTYIYEGVEKYWQTSLEHPEEYARWVVMYTPDSETGKQDPVALAMEENHNFIDNYTLAYQAGEIQIFKRNE